MLCIFIAKFVTIPIHSLCIDAIDGTVPGMLEVIALGQLRGTITTPFFRVNAAAWDEDCIKEVESNNLVCNVIFLCRNDISKFCFESPV